jgi:hypothetical protein
MEKALLVVGPATSETILRNPSTAPFVQAFFLTKRLNTIGRTGIFNLERLESKVFNGFSLHGLERIAGFGRFCGS